MRTYLLGVSAVVFSVVVLAGGSAVAAATNDDAGVAVTDDSAITAQMQSLGSSSGADIYGVGGGQANGGLVNFDFSAHTGPQGDFGHVGVTQTTPTGTLLVKYRLDVTCVHVHGPPGPFNQPFDRGLIRGVVKSVTPVPNVFGITEGAGRIIGIVDAGNQSGPLPVDTFFPFNFDLPGNTCKLFFLTGQANNVTQGNVNIKVD